MVKKRLYEKGDIIYVDCMPQAGHEQNGRRPALVISSSTYNKLCDGFAVVCPITNTDRHHPLHIPLADKCKTTGFVMVDQFRSMDINSRNAEYYDKAPNEIVKSVIDIVNEILE